MTNVVSLASAKKQRESKQIEKQFSREGLTNHQIFNDIFEDVIADWQRFAIKNKLNEFIASKIPAYARGAENSDYSGDLNLLSAIEQKLNMRVSVFYPEATPGNPIGWLVGFHRGTEVFFSPPTMATEANARALNVLLFLGLEYALISLNRK